MATHLDLEEQEQLDQLKAFWAKYGNTITWIAIVALSVFAGWNFYQRHLLSQAGQAAGMYDELVRVAASKDLAKVERVFADIKEKYPSTTYAQQAALMASKALAEGGKPEQAKGALGWIAEKSEDAGYRAIARLRLSAILVDAKALDEALTQLKGDFPAEFAGLVADRRGDIYALQGKKAEAKAEYERSFAAMDERAEHRRLVEAKLNAMGIDPSANASKAGGK
jgi:predicted negative regulator of RcsB-dependent stress response